MSEVRPTAAPPRRLLYEPMSPDDARALLERALSALETRGVRVASERARDLLEGAGATVDRSAGTARVPAPLANGALDRAPAAFMIAGRQPERDATVSAEAPLLAAAAAAAAVLDVESGERREATARDVIDACRLADALFEVAAVWAPPAQAGGARARGCPPALEPCLTGTTKHVIFTDVADVAAAEVLVGAAAAVAGSAGEARRRPPFSALERSPWPDDEAVAAIDAALTCAEAGLPVGFLLPLAGEESASDVAAAATAVAAAALAAGALVQLAIPGAPFVAPLLPAVVASATSAGPAPATTAGPAAYLATLAASQILGRVHLPVATGFAAGPATGAPRWEAAVDNVFLGLTGALSRSGLVCGAGLLDGGDAYAPEQLMLDVETFSYAAAVGAGMAVDDETIAAETIAAVGAGGNALGQKHTRRHMKDVWRTRLFDRASYEAWSHAGRPGAADRARERAAEILATHDVPPPEAETVATLRRIIEKAGL